MMPFNAVKWARRKMRGRDFGWHGQSYVYLPAGEVISFTPNVEMMNWNFHIGASVLMFWRKNFAVLKDTDGTVYPLYGFVTEDGKEPASRPEGHWDGRERVGLPMGKEMFLHLHGTGKVKVNYVGASIVS